MLLLAAVANARLHDLSKTNVKGGEHASSLTNVHNVQHMPLIVSVCYQSNCSDEWHPRHLMGRKLKWAISLHYNHQTIPRSHAIFAWDLGNSTPVKPASTVSEPTATGKTSLERFVSHRLL